MPRHPPNALKRLIRSSSAAHREQTPHATTAKPRLVTLSTHSITRLAVNHRSLTLELALKARQPVPTASRIPIHNVKEQVSGIELHSPPYLMSSEQAKPGHKALPPTSTGGADRDRTGDPLLAKQVLSQLSYGPKLMGQNWWAREDLNFRPHAYQARALTS